MDRYTDSNRQVQRQITNKLDCQIDRYKIYRWKESESDEDKNRVTPHSESLGLKFTNLPAGKTTPEENIGTFK